MSNSINIGRMVGHFNPYTDMHQTDSWVLPQQAVGIEIEIENANRLRDWLRDTSPRWASKGDSSLRNNGVELTTVGQGLAGSQLDKAMSEVEEAFAATKSSVSVRTSIHVHMDMTDVTQEQLGTFLALYFLYESALFDFDGNERDASIYCVPWEGSANIVRRVSELLRTNSPESFCAVLDKYFAKYSALNLRCLRTFGTVEFRHLLTTHDTGKIRNWINILMQLKKAAMAMTGRDIMTELSANGWGEFNYSVWDKMTPILLPDPERDFWDKVADSQALMERIQNHNCIDSHRTGKGSLLESKFGETPEDAAKVTESHPSDLAELYRIIREEG